MALNAYYLIIYTFDIRNIWVSAIIFINIFNSITRTSKGVECFPIL